MCHLFNAIYYSVPIIINVIVIIVMKVIVMIMINKDGDNNSSNGDNNDITNIIFVSNRNYNGKNNFLFL